jgi:hypothetical protein
MIASRDDETPGRRPVRGVRVVGRRRGAVTAAVGRDRSSAP